MPILLSMAETPGQIAMSLMINIVSMEKIYSENKTNWHTHIFCKRRSHKHIRYHSD